ncbi:MAG: glycosyltransferase family 2 protein [Methanobacterium sp.]
MKDRPLVSIIILNWNGKKVTEKCLTTLIDVTSYSNFNLIVIENNSSDGSAKFLSKKFGNKIDLICLNENLGFIKGNNHGIEYSFLKYHPQYIILLNNDTEIIEEDWLDKLINIIDKDEKIGIIGPKLLFPDRRIQWSGRKKGCNTVNLILQTLTARMNPGFGENEKNAPYANFIGEVNTISGACMVIKSDLIKKIGFLDLSLYPMYQEDVEYSLRAQEAGYKVFYHGDVNIIHHEGYTEKLDTLENNMEMRQYWALRNSMFVCIRYYGWKKTFFIGIPIFLFYNFFDKKHKTKKLSIYNLKFRDNILNKFKIFFKASKTFSRRFKNERNKFSTDI